jgi:hypothetical protein
LEIGISTGASLRAWKDYFPNATIYGIDLTIHESVLNDSRIKYAVADQSDVRQLQAAMESWTMPTFDSIIDDGGHSVKQQRVSIEYFWSFLKPGGYYIIEDLHTNIPEMQHIHPHLNPRCTHIDERPTIHERIFGIMGGMKNRFAFDTSEIEEVYYFNNPKTLSLSCAFKKVNNRA